jgi:superfamily II DNA helicase RecQ
MQVQIFSIQAIDNSEDLQKFNAFLRGHKIIDIEKQFVNNGSESFWSFCLRYVESPPNNNTNFSNNRKEKIDYKEILDEATFLTFSKLREIRKTIALADAVPAYAVFTDQELSEIAKLSEVTISSIQSINGIGQKKAEKYASQIQNMLQNEINETSG